MGWRWKCLKRWIRDCKEEQGRATDDTDGTQIGDDGRGDLEEIALRGGWCGGDNLGMRYAMLVAGVMVGLAGGCEIDQLADEAPVAHGPPAVIVAPSVPTFEEEILSVAKEYKSYARVSDKANWSPFMCAVPPPAGVQRSTSRDDEAHGRKLYFLYASHEGAYENMSWGRESEFDAAMRLGVAGIPRLEQLTWSNPVGMAVVKESFKPVEVAQGEAPAKVDSNLHGKRLPDDYAEMDGKLYKAGEPMGLFIMLKLDPKREGTDKGWIYAVTTPDAKSVLEVGKIASCMECHVKTDRDRLYGHKKSWGDLKIDGKQAVGKKDGEGAGDDGK